MVLAVSFVYQWRAGDERPAGLTAVLAPVNLFTGVFGCGLICLLNPWIDRRLPVRHRLPLALVALNLIGAGVFLLVGLRGYWEFAGWWAIGILLGTLAARRRGGLVGQSRGEFALTAYRCGISSSNVSASDCNSLKSRSSMGMP